MLRSEGDVDGRGLARHSVFPAFYRSFRHVSCRSRSSFLNSVQRNRNEMVSSEPRAAVASSGEFSIYFVSLKRKTALIASGYLAKVFILAVGLYYSCVSSKNSLLTELRNEDIKRVCQNVIVLKK